MARDGGSIQDQFPMLASFSADPENLSPESEGDGRNARIASVWPYLIHRVACFAATLRPRESANYDVEDAISELVVRILERDHKFDPARGKYVTFVAAICDSELCSIRDSSRTVASPRNTSCRLKAYEEARADGTITERKAKTHDDIKRAVCGYAVADGNDHWGDRGPVQEAEDREDRDSVRSAIIDGLAALTPLEAQVVGENSGLWGRRPRPLPEIAERTGRTLSAVKRARRSGYDKINARLTESGHPAVASDN